MQSRKVVPQSSPQDSALKPVRNSSQKPKLAAERRERERIREAYAFTNSPREANEKALLACAYLLDWGSDLGNESITGAVAQGVAGLLRKVAQDQWLVEPGEPS